jgi:hypothetical protein
VDKVLRTLSAVKNGLNCLGSDLAPDLLRLVVAGKVDTRTLKRLRPESAIASFAPYFGQRAQPRPEVAGSPSPHFANSKSRPAKQSQQETNRKLTSYFEVMPTT